LADAYTGILSQLLKAKWALNWLLKSERGSLMTFEKLQEHISDFSKVGRGLLAAFETA